MENWRSYAPVAGVRLFALPHSKQFRQIKFLMRETFSDFTLSPEVVNWQVKIVDQSFQFWQ